MRMRGRDIIGIVLIIIGLMLAIVGVVTPDIGSGGIRGMGSSSATYDLANMLLIGVGAGMIVCGTWLLLDRKKYVPLEVETKATVQVTEEKKAERPKEESISESNYLVLRLLNGDEREMYRTIVDAGGAMLQKDLIVKLKWSDAKVSRTIDKLIEKRVVSKERYGSTNRVKVDLTYERE